VCLVVGFVANVTVLVVLVKQLTVINTMFKSPGSRASSYPSRVFKGMRMAGRGGEKKTFKTLEF
jgi:ribosomal protein L3